MIFFMVSLAVHLFFLFVVSLLAPDARISVEEISLYRVDLVSTLVEAPSIAPPGQSSTAPLQRQKALSFNPKKLSTISGTFAQKRNALLSSAAIEEVRKRVKEAEDNSPSENEIQKLVSDYYAYVGYLVKSNWRVPLWISSLTEAETVIILRIARDGALTYAAFEKSSGNHHIDESAMRAVRASVPFAPLPIWMRDDYLEIGIKFNPREAR
ncbi:MAG: TonB C-terminal domain-containing protein [Deltaproteobacteria bacterium]|nr:TonB C-terminal domain-containing protein [Deltaproteobacteria bacterium]